MKKIQNVGLLTLQLPPYYEEDNPPLGRAETNNRWLDHKSNQNVGVLTLQLPPYYEEDPKC